MVHRDIKPANLWLEAGHGRVKILDFGLARSAANDSGLTKTGIVVGTPVFIVLTPSAPHHVAFPARGLQEVRRAEDAEVAHHQKERPSPAPARHQDVEGERHRQKHAGGGQG